MSGPPGGSRLPAFSILAEIAQNFVPADVNAAPRISDNFTMNKRSFADLMVGVLAFVSLTGLAAIAVEPGAGSRNRTAVADERWSLPVKRRRRRVREDACRHCSGSGTCDACMPATCRVCRGTGLQPRDASLVPRLTELWNGAS
jgi:hypothetical protein